MINLINKLKKIIKLIIFVFIIVNCFKYVFLKEEIVQTSAEENILVGYKEFNYGDYSKVRLLHIDTGEVETIYNESGYQKEKAHDISKEKLSTRLDYLKNNPGYTYGYFKSKLQTTWLNPTFQTIWCSTPGIVLDQDPGYNNYVCGHQLLISIVCGKAYSIEEKVMDIYQILVFLSASFGLVFCFKESNEIKKIKELENQKNIKNIENISNNDNNFDDNIDNNIENNNKYNDINHNANNSLKKLLLPLIFLGGFSFHLIWETKAIYVLQYFYLLVPYAAFGIYQLFTLIETFFQRKLKLKTKN